MKNELATLDAAEEVAHKPIRSSRMGVAFGNANLVKVVPAEARTAIKLESDATGRAALAEIIKPTLSNLFLLGCLIGLFVLYCGSCVIHALTLPVRRKSS
jgi:hypothetical protein